MQSQRQTVTDRLADVIHIIHIGGKSGVLTVERGEGKRVEEGFITFINGRVVEARIGTQTGLSAFNYLNTWLTCRFSLQSRGVDEAQITSPIPLPSTYNTLAPARNASSQYQPALDVSSTVPVRLPSGEDTVQLPGNMHLSRTHRRLLLLIDGHREQSDLARLMGRSLVEIQELLVDLERNGLIQL